MSEVMNVGVMNVGQSLDALLLSTNTNTNKNLFQGIDRLLASRALVHTSVFRHHQAFCDSEFKKLISKPNLTMIDTDK